MLDYEYLTRLAKECGFTDAGPLDVSTLRFFPEVRDMCATDRCHSYNKNWSSPPACGTLDEMRDRVNSYSEGIIVQTVGKLEDSFDWEATVETAKLHAENFAKMCGILKKDYPGMFAMGAGTCTKCKTCTYVEGEPCRSRTK
jgi:predicted metal-binding protein